MKGGLVAMLASALIFCATPSSALEGDDTKAIEAIIETWNQGWKEKNAKLAASAYSEDADWTNAFGMRKRGRAEIEQFLTQVFSLPHVMAGQGSRAGQEIRFAEANVALVTTLVERTGQLTPDGKPLGTRRTSHLRVLVRTGETWKVVSHLISDARDPASPSH